MKTRRFASWLLAALLFFGFCAGGHCDVQFTNLVNLTGWTVEDATNSGVFPAAPFVLLPGTTSLFGTMSQGGSFDAGVIVRLSLGFQRSPGGPLQFFGFTNMHQFTPAEGGYPLAPLTVGPGPTLYGTTASIGFSNTLYRSGMGTVYQMATNGSFSVLHRFGTVTNSLGHALDGANSQAGLAFGPDGKLYGTTAEGGTNGYEDSNRGDGTAFVIDTNGVFVSLHSFNGSDGAAPTALTYWTNGFFCGVATAGGPSARVVNSNGAVGFGTIFTLETNGSVAALYAFGSVTNTGGNALDGYSPNPLLRGLDGNFYGTTRFGGSNTALANTNGDIGWGTIFRLSTNGALTTLYSFGAATNIYGGSLDGGSPAGALVLGTNGAMFGVTTYGGTSNIGTVFCLTTNGALTTVYSLVNRFPVFRGQAETDGAYPMAGLCQGPGGFYGSTFGFLKQQVFSPAKELADSTIFSLGPERPRTVISWPGLAWLVGATNSLTTRTESLYPSSGQWTLPSGDNSNNISALNTTNLTIFGVTPSNAGTYTFVTTTLAETLTNTVVIVVAPLLVAEQPANTLARAGQPVTLTASAQSVLPLSFQWQFDGTNLTDTGRISGSMTTSLSLTNSATADSGTYTIIFQNGAGAVTSAPAVLTVVPLTIPGYELTSLHAFDGTNDGWNLLSSVIQARDGYLYGAAYSGGSNGWGTIYRAGTNGGFEALHSFGAILSTNGVALDGEAPRMRLLQGQDGWMYGSTSMGGASNLGTIFRIDTQGNLQTLVTFNGAAADGGEFPAAPMIQGAHGTLYSLLNDQLGGTGILYSMGPTWALTNLHTFQSLDGSSFGSALNLTPNGDLFGLASYGGEFDDGTFYRLGADGTFTNLHSFTPWAEGANPEGDLIQDDAGNFYGVTGREGPHGWGAVFKIDRSGNVTTLHGFGAVTNNGYIFDGYGVSGLTRAVDGNFYGATGGGGPNNFGTIFRITTNGDYTTVVWFDGVNGSDPSAAPAQGWDGNLYGTTDTGGPDEFGTIYRLAIPQRPPKFQTAAQTNGVFRFTLSAIGGRTYQVQYATDLSHWTNLGAPITASALSIEFSDPATNEQRFYRVEQTGP